MPKKDTASAVLGMLSSAGSQTRPVGESPAEPAGAAPAEQAPVTPAAAQVADPPAPAHASVSSLPTPRSETQKPAPLTLRLRPGTAQAVRSAWLEAKRDDVLLTAQDFASTLIEEALANRRRREHRTTAAR